MAGLVRVAGLVNEIEAQVLAGILEEGKIPYLIRSYRDTAYDGLFQEQKGWGAIFAPEEYRQEIEDILASLRSEMT